MDGPSGPPAGLRGQRTSDRSLAPGCDRSGRAAGPWIERTGWLTPYLAETVANEAARLGESTRVDVWVAGEAAWNSIVGASARFARLSADGIRSLVHRESRLQPSKVLPAARR